MFRVVLAISLIAAAVADPTSRLVGSITTHEARPGETLASIAARAGIEARTLARDNGLPPTARIAAGEILVIDNRHIAPAGYSDGIVLTVPQRMLFVFEGGEPIRAFPVAVGRADWCTPLGSLSIAAKELDPVWDVPVSIQREMARTGRTSRLQGEAWTRQSAGAPLAGPQYFQRRHSRYEPANQHLPVHHARLYPTTP